MPLSLDRADLTKPETWKMPAPDALDVEGRCLSGLRANGIPATGVALDPTKLKGGYICDTMRIVISYGTPVSPAGTKRNGAVSERPTTAILKIASPGSADHDVAMKLRLYEREWHFYEQLSHRVPVRCPKWLGSVKDVETGLTTEGVMLEDLDVPGAVLCPELDDEGVMATIASIAKLHAAFWNAPELASGALGVKPHNATWYQPGWGDDLAGYWPRFAAKWRAPDARRPSELSAEAFAAGELIIAHFGWIQDQLSMRPHCFNHGDVKPPNMFMMPGNVPAFIDWQYTAVGKGCQDIIFFLVEGYDIAEARRLEPLAMRKYHQALLQAGVPDYSFDDLTRDWQLAAMHFPFYVAMWFGTTPDDALVDPDFPRRFVPRAFDAILRNGATKLLDHSGLHRVPSDTLVDVALPDTVDELKAELIKAKRDLAKVTVQRDEFKSVLAKVTTALHSAGNLNL